MSEIQLTLNTLCPGCGATVLLYLIETEEKGTIHTKSFCVNADCTYEEGNTIDIEKLLINEGFVLAKSPQPETRPIRGTTCVVFYLEEEAQPVNYRITRKGKVVVEKYRKEKGS